MGDALEDRFRNVVAIPAVKHFHMQVATQVIGQRTAEFLAKGQRKVSIIAWYLTDYFFKGERVVLSNFKTAAGVFEQDKYLSILQGIVNLVLSIALVFKIGLAGVFIGTIVSGLIANITKPIIIYRVCFEKSAISYFQESIKYLLVIGAALAVLIPLQNLLMPQVTIAKFALMIVIITVVFNGIFPSHAVPRL